jgi:antibiotic biosynthesis monooxygenase (ABM) superfamily enzyme
MTQQPNARIGDTEIGGPATVVITRVIRPGHRDDYERWLVRMIAAAAQFPNNLGAVVLTPKPGEPDVFRLVHRLADEPSLRAWEQSDTRRDLSREADAFSSAHRQEGTGMETWFTVSGAPVPPPPRKWKMALVTFAVVYGITWLIIPREQAWLPESWPFYATNVITNAVIAVLMTYAVMPGMARVLRRWLY